MPKPPKMSKTESRRYKEEDPPETRSRKVKKPQAPGKGSYWDSQLPSMESLAARVGQKERPLCDPRNLVVLREAKGPHGPLVAFPLCEIGLPDFVDFKYPDSKKFIARV